MYGSRAGRSSASEGDDRADFERITFDQHGDDIDSCTVTASLASGVDYDGVEKLFMRNPQSAAEAVRRVEQQTGAGAIVVPVGDGHEVKVLFALCVIRTCACVG